MARDVEAWLAARRYTPEVIETALRVLEDVRGGMEVVKAIQKNPLPKGGHIAKHALVAAYQQMLESGAWQPDPALLLHIRMKPMRSLSGVTTVTILTRPNPCPGKCVFCPDDARMPKSYLPDEPAAARAFQSNFDPYVQVQTRLQSLTAVGHPTDKIELLILGGTWDAYSKDYQEWFIQRCFDAMNECDSNSLADAQHINETSAHRNVGLSIETRPDEITRERIAWMRRLGVTKVQMGAQSLDDDILLLNCRGHTTAELQYAMALLRAAGFKIVLHWMPNLLGATPASDRVDFARLWALPEQGGLGICPDELKIYPTQLLENAPLYACWQRGEYHPYSTEELIDLVASLKPSIPVYCRVNRVIRDIPSENVVEGNRRTSLRQDILIEVARRGQVCRCIRCREVRERNVALPELRLDVLHYQPAHANEFFLSYVTPDDRLAGYLRLSLPNPAHPVELPGLQDLTNAGIIREIHVYGQSLPVGGDQKGAAQHIGLGTALMDRAAEITRKEGFTRMAVIAAVGTRQYYAARGFKMGELYMVKTLAG